MKNVSRKQFQKLPVAMPPKNEQLRIEEKFNKMVELCDTLKPQTQTTQLNLANAIVEKIITYPNHNIEKVA